MQEWKQKSLKLNLGWSGKGWSLAHARKKLQTAKLQKANLSLSLILVWEILWRDFGKSDGMLSKWETPLTHIFADMALNDILVSMFKLQVKELTSTGSYHWRFPRGTCNGFRNLTSRVSTLITHPLQHAVSYTTLPLFYILFFVQHSISDLVKPLRHSYKSAYLKEKNLWRFTP